VAWAECTSAHSIFEERNRPQEIGAIFFVFFIKKICYFTTIINISQFYYGVIMKQLNFFLTFMISISTTSCVAMQNDEAPSSNTSKSTEKTISTLFKLAYEHKPTKARTQESFYKQNLNNFNNHIKQLLEANNQPQTDHYDPTKSIRLKMITDDLIPLNYKMKTILEYIENNNLYHTNSTGQTHTSHQNSPRLIIINSIINSLKDSATNLSDQYIEDYQLLINHVTYFAIKTEYDPYILEALKSIANKKYSAEILATLLNEETLNQENLEKKLKEYLDRKQKDKEEKK
jgi:hypothetical protein